MNILIAGYGNIGKSIHTLLKKYPISHIENIHIAEIKEGLSAVSGLANLHQQLDVIINVTPDDDEKLVQMCENLGVHYIDTGFELAYKIKDLMTSKTKNNGKSIKLWGFGMNPGLIEYMYRKQNLNKKHIVIEFETDTATAAQSNGLFHTWSPETYISESSIEPPFAYINGSMQIIDRNATGADIELFVDGEVREYLWIPHEELFSMAQSNKNCALTAFLYCAPKNVQRHSIQSRKNKILQKSHIPVLHDIHGYDCVGILVCVDQELTYVYNKAIHQDCYRDFSVNGTCWQVACGIYVALTIMPYLKAGDYTVSSITSDVFHIIDSTLEKLGFNIETSKKVITSNDFWDKIMSPFSLVK